MRRGGEGGVGTRLSSQLSQTGPKYRLLLGNHLGRVLLLCWLIKGGNKTGGHNTSYTSGRIAQAIIKYLTNWEIP